MKTLEGSSNKRAGMLAALALGGAMMVGALAPTQAEAQVGLSIGINQPGVYGRVDIGNGPPPAVYYPQPVVIQPPPVAVPRQPIYLRVPPGYEANWGRYCDRYAACGQPVYFVRDRLPPPPPPRPYYRPHDHRFDHDRPGYRYDDHRGPPRFDDRRP